MGPEWIILVATVFGGISVASLARSIGRRIERGGKTAPPPAASADAERLARLEAAVETLAAAVERTAEEQRFLTGLLAERSGVESPRP